MTDWRRNKESLLENSEPLIRALIAENNASGDELAAFGYVFEFGRGQLCFEMCANTARHASELVEEYLSNCPDACADEVRWNSGDYDYPGAVQERFGGWSGVWWDELSRLDRMAEDEMQSSIVHQQVADICCEVIAELAKRGILGDWSVIDFNVSALLDDVEQVKKRNDRIRDLIRSAA